MPLIEFFRELTRKLTGKQMSAADAERWKELAELLGTEAERAASRTSISNLPAFLTEHLRRRLAREEKADRKVKPDLVGKGEQTPAPQPMADNERAEITSMITEMVTSGSYTIDQAEAQFGGGLRPEDWSAIKSAIAETQKPES